MIQYEVKGSTGNIYTVTAYKSGPDFFIKCTCPASSVGGKLCRHSAKLLVGDISDVVDQDADFYPLFDAAKGTMQLSAALSFKDAAVTEIARLPALFHFRERFEEPLLALGWHLRMDEHYDEDRGEQLLGLHDITRQGKLRVAPKHTLIWRPFEWDYDWNGDEMVKGARRDRQKPWVANGVSYKTLGRAAVRVLRDVGLMPKE